jgi:hypothetical protein
VSTCLISLIKNGATRCQAIEINLSSGIDLGALFEMNIQRDRTMFEGRAAEILKSIEVGCVKAPPHDDAIASAFHNAGYVSHARQAWQRLIQQEVISSLESWHHRGGMSEHPRSGLRLARSSRWGLKPMLRRTRTFLRKGQHMEVRLTRQRSPRDRNSRCECPKRILHDPVPCASDGGSND